VAFVIWTLVVLVWYFAWGIRHSELGRAERERTRIEGQS
jgi:hypothetical protein